MYVDKELFELFRILVFYLIKPLCIASTGRSFLYVFDNFFHSY